MYLFFSFPGALILVLFHFRFFALPPIIPSIATGLMAKGEKMARAAWASYFF